MTGSPEEDPEARRAVAEAERIIEEAWIENRPAKPQETTTDPPPSPLPVSTPEKHPTLNRRNFLTLVGSVVVGMVGVTSMRVAWDELETDRQYREALTNTSLAEDVILPQPNSTLNILRRRLSFQQRRELRLKEVTALTYYLNGNSAAKKVLGWGLTGLVLSLSGIGWTFFTLNQMRKDLK